MTGPATAAARLADYCTALRWDALPPPVQERTRELLLDLLGVAVRGSAEPSSVAARDAVRALQSGGAVSVIGDRFTTAAAWAALANGTAAHAIEMDDVTTASSLHPGTVVIPAAVAVAEERRAAPTALLAAIVAGYEVTMRVGNALNPAAAYARGFHPTGVAGVFGAATAAGLLCGLDAAGLTRALGIAGTMASGSLEYLAEGAWTKRLNAGWAAHAGIVAAALAQAGFSGPASVFEGRLGLLHGYSDAPVTDQLLDGLGEDLQVMRVSIKPYACCRYNHGLIDCMLALQGEHGFQTEDVEAIRLGVLGGGALLVAEPIERKRAPRNVVDAQFSAPFAAAVALVRGAAGLAEYAQASVDDPAIRDLMARADCFRDPSLDAVYPQRWPAMAEIRLRDGRTVATRVEHAKGEPENPVPRAELVAKFASLVCDLLSPAEAHALAQRILHLDDTCDLGAVLALLTCRRTAHGPA